MLKKLAESDLDAGDAKALGLEPFTETESPVLGLSRTGTGFKIPYFDAAGKPLSMFRFRYFDTEYTSGFLKGEKLRKYDQPAKTDPEVYLPRLPNIDWEAVALDPSVPLIITEGELKAACATKHGFLTIGLGGVYSFGRRARHQTLLPALQRFKWAGRQVYICYDSDAIFNRLVMTAEIRLARLLTDEGAYVKIVRLPGDEQHPETKVGLDDYIVANGKQMYADLLQSANEYGPFEALHQLNTEVVYVRFPSMVVAYPEENHPEGQPRYRMIQPSKFVREVYAPRKYWETVGEKQVEKSAAAEWMEWPARAEVDSITYAPGGPLLVGKQLNLWEGWGAEPMKGDVSLFLKYFDHITQGLTKPERRWFLQWLAYPIQHSGTKLNTAVVFWGREQGTGKSLMGYTMKQIYGVNGKELTKEQLSGSFNAWAINRQFIMGEEITGGNSREYADLLKNMITGREITINQKYIPAYSIRNCVNFYFTSNHQDAFFISDEDRRYFVHEVTCDKLPDAFFKEYDAWYKSPEGAAALRYYFEFEVDTSDFNPNGAAPRTEAREEMIEANDSGAMRFARELLSSSNAASFLVPDTSNSACKTKALALEHRDIWGLDELLEEYWRHHHDKRESEFRNVNSKTLGHALTAVDTTLRPIKKVRVAGEGGGQRSLWVLWRREEHKGITGDALGRLYAEQKYGEKGRPGDGTAMGHKMGHKPRSSVTKRPRVRNRRRRKGAL